MPPAFAKATGTTVPIHVVSVKDCAAFLNAADSRTRAWAETQGFTGRLGQVCQIPGDKGLAAVLAGYGTDITRMQDRLYLGNLPGALPAGAYRLKGIRGARAEQAALAWLLGSYTFNRYKALEPPAAQLVVPTGVDAARLQEIAAADALARDLINTPTADMGPDDLEEAFRKLAQTQGAGIRVIRGTALLRHNLPMIHAVGRASDQAPRLLDMTWGKAGDPKVTLVGKGVCFDTGGLNLKPVGAMALMKKDMAGAATVLGLARMIMALGLPVRLRVLVPVVENSVSAGAFRPGDVLVSRKGLTVEINSTDAEGRLVLADALTLADEEQPALLICKATLTGAARVALGPDVMPFYCDNDDLSAAIAGAGAAVEDPLWRMPFWTPYEAMIESDIADLDNAPEGGFGGSVTAALFLRRFVENAGDFIHLDIYGWTPKTKPGRLKGGACMGARALLKVLEDRYR
ncbi:MAG: leucyl aminopeptidase family protein [Rhodobacteraceae bacterium]|nr:leucyl aminopeptidase family protein [Paracoccaceae bacterium]